MLKEDVVFKCCAINDKNAVRKFKRWQAWITTSKMYGVVWGTKMHYTYCCV
jgi:hypothetical protein